MSGSRKHTNIIIPIIVIVLAVVLVGMLLFLENKNANKPVGTYAPDQSENTHGGTEETQPGTPTTKPGRGPMLTIIDDDGDVAFYEKWVPIIEEKDVSISTAVVTDWVGTKSSMSWETIQKCADAGAEILCHTKDHVATDVVRGRSLEQVTKSYQDAQKALQDHGYAGNILIYSGGSGDLEHAREAASVVFDAAFVSAGNKPMTEIKEPHRILRYVIGDSKGNAPTLEELKAIIDLAVEKNAWVVFMTHSHYDVMTDEYMQTLAAAIDYCAEVGVDVVSAAEGLQAFNE